MRAGGRYGQAGCGGGSRTSGPEADGRSLPSEGSAAPNPPRNHQAAVQALPRGKPIAPPKRCHMTGGDGHRLNARLKAYPLRPAAQLGEGSGHNAFRWWAKQTSYGILELLRCREGNLLAGLDFDRLPGGWVTAGTRRTIAHLQNAQSGQANLVAGLEPLGHHLDQGV